MIPAIVLVVWMAVGAALAVATRPAGDPKLAWVPMGVFLGPFWAVIAHERHALSADPVNVDVVAAAAS